MKIVNRTRHGFALRRIQRPKEPHALHYLSQRASFWIAALSVIAFVAGNMMGQLGWHTFWASVLGKTDDSLIVYTGTVSPIAQIPDEERWARYGGNAQEHTFQQVPRDLLVTLPTYRASQASADGGTVYSIGHLGSYTTGSENSGSHVGVDIRVPVGTPVRAVMNGVVERTDATGNGGFGKMIILRHPNVPDPSNARATTTLYSIYGHLSGVLVEEGSVVSKGEHIGYSGKTGFATGPHLHFQIDRVEAPWHPFWPFTGEDQRKAGLSFTQAVDRGLGKSDGERYTVNPMLYVQANYGAVRSTIASADPTSAIVSPRATTVRSSPDRVSRVVARREQRIALRGRQTVAVHSAAPAAASSVAGETVVQRSTVVTASPDIPVAVAPSDLTIEITHDGSYSGRSWEEVRIRVLDAAGNAVRAPNLSSDIYLRTAFGEAEFRPAQISSLDLERGGFTVQMLPRGRRTVIIEAKPYGAASKPMVYRE